MYFYKIQFNSFQFVIYQQTRSTQKRLIAMNVFNLFHCEKIISLVQSQLFLLLFVTDRMYKKMLRKKQTRQIGYAAQQSYNRSLVLSIVNRL